MAYEIDYNDQRFQDVEADKKSAISEMEKTYSGMIDDSDAFYQAQIDASKEWEKKQTELQNEQTNFAIQEIEQQKAQAQKDYTKEQSGAYTDWQKQSNQYGANAEAIAAQGLQRTGYSESSQVSMYNTYQNRVATAREAYTLAVQNYNNSITEARLQNNSALAEIAYNALQQQLELSLQGFQYKNQLLLEMADKKTVLENEYYNRYQDVLAQINTENALAEQIRQYNESLAEEKRQFNQQMAFEQEQFDWTKAQAKGASSQRKIIRSGSGGSGNTGLKIEKSNGGLKSGGDNGITKSSYSDVESALNKAIAAGATKDKVSNAISLALRNGKITKAEATKLRQSFTPRGVQY